MTLSGTSFTPFERCLKVRPREIIVETKSMDYGVWMIRGMIFGA